MKFAVIESGGKQYLVAPKDKLLVEKLAGNEGASVFFDKVLVVGDDATINLGKPYVTGAKVEGKIVKQVRDKKVLVMKYHNKTRYRRKRGHRQAHTQVEIISV